MGFASIRSLLPAIDKMRRKMKPSVFEQNWEVAWEHHDDCLVTTPAPGPADLIGCLRACDASWISIARIRSVEGWIGTVRDRDHHR
jgi:hypothetical protein